MLKGFFNELSVQPGAECTQILDFASGVVAYGDWSDGRIIENYLLTLFQSIEQMLRNDIFQACIFMHKGSLTRWFGIFNAI